MKGKLTLLAGAAIGYVFGTAAGRQRFEQLKAQAKRAMENPKLQQAAHDAQHKAAEAASNLTHAAAEKVGRHSGEGTPGSPDVPRQQEPAYTSQTPQTAPQGSPPGGG